jgi:hypothetical protein
MSGGGTDPFSNTTTRNILQHIISPKVVSDGVSGYAVKTDLINIDDAYINNQLYTDSITVQDNGVTNADKLILTTDASKTYITSTTSAGNRSELILVNGGTEIDNQDNSNNGTLLLQTDTSGNGYVRAGYSGSGTENLYLGTQSVNTVTLTPQGNMTVTGTVTGSNLKRYTQTGVSYSGGYYAFSSALIPANSPGVYTFLIYSSTGAILQGTIIVGLSSNATAFGNYYNTSLSGTPPAPPTPPAYDLGSSGPNFFLRESVDLTTGSPYTVVTASIIIQQIA